MTATQRQREELHNLLLLRQEGDVSADAIRQIDELVQNDPDLLEMYVEYSRLFSDLRLGLTNDRILAALASLFDVEGQSVGSALTTDKQDNSEDNPHHECAEDLDSESTQDANLLSAPALPPSFFSTAAHHVIGYFSQEIPFSLLIAAMITGLGLWIGSMFYVTHCHEQLAGKTNAKTPIAEQVSSRVVIGRITSIVDCYGQIDSKFKPLDSAPTNPRSEIINQKSLVSLGDKFVLSSGLLEITYDTGAKVVLQSPVTYEVDSAVGGFLSIGKLTARLEKKESGITGQGSEEVASGQSSVASGQWSVASETNLPSPASGRGAGGEGSRQFQNVASKDASGSRGQGSEVVNHKSEIINQKFPAPAFAVRTPTAIVTDLGTEFGVEVDRSGATRSYVFKGRIEVASVHQDRHTKPVQLRENQSVVVDSSGEMELYKSVDRSRFVRRAEFNPFPGLVDLSEGKMVFYETFQRATTAFPQQYPNWFYNPNAAGGKDSTGASAIVQNGVLRISRNKTEVRFEGVVPVDTEIASIAREFSGRMFVAADLGCDSSNYGNSHIALRLGEIVIAFHPGHYARTAKETMRGAFRVDGIVVNTDMGFVPDVDVLHHLYVYYDGRDAFQVRLVDGLYRTNVFHSSFTTSQLQGKKFTISIHRSGMESTGMFDNLRVIELPEIKTPTASQNGGSDK